jgi:hypothetical protein
MKSFLAVVAAVASIAAAPAANERIADFRVGGVSFALPMPDGYCLPVDRQADIAQLLAASDTGNVTDLTLMRCDKSVAQGANDYTIIKTPRTAMVSRIERADLLAQIGKEFDSPVAGGGTDTKSLDTAAKSLSDTMGAKVSLSGDFAPRGKDDVCGYMAGTLHVASPTVAYDQPLGACLTAVGGRMLFIYRAGTGKDDASILKLMREARAMALSIRTITGT